MNERDMRGIMNDQDLVNELRGYAQWAKDAPDGALEDMGHVLTEAADVIERQQTRVMELEKAVEELFAQLPRWMTLPKVPEVENA